ncbi:hypothetical protein QYE76_039879 [Lolium multiflorum]|uniref:Uncharacterized protein n=1 Tax=Lolium multiflorum TaxID=4521 RepID=A0AAD8TCC7_LOLMU|nr:hypothetical protein QYE76_039879 [Lolium multiflorum]
MHNMLSPFTGVELYHRTLRFLQALGSVPLVHVDDVCGPHICMERLADIASGRYLCAAAYPNMQDILEHYAGKHPELKLMIKEVVGEGECKLIQRSLWSWGSSTSTGQRRC